MFKRIKNLISRVKNYIAQKIASFKETVGFLWRVAKENPQSLFASAVCVIATTSDTTSQITDTVLAWMPLIITFAMLGMVLGILKKLGKF